MNRLYFFLAFFIIILLHYFLLMFFFEKEVKQVSKPVFNKVSVQLAVLQTPKVVKKKIKKPVEEVKKEVEKKVFKKPIKEKAKRKLVEKVTPKKKKPVKKKEKKVEKKLEKKVEKKVEKEIKKQEVKQTVIKKASVSKKEQTQSLEKYKKYKKDYMTELRAAIDKNKKYPIASKRLEEEGYVIISFKLLKSGLFENIKLHKSSGKRRLDKAGLKAVQLTAKFKPFPKEIYKEFLDLKVPIKFQISN